MYLGCFEFQVESCRSHVLLNQMFSKYVSELSTVLEIGNHALKGALFNLPRCTTNLLYIVFYPNFPFKYVSI